MSLDFKDIILLFQKDNFTEAIQLLNQHYNENKNNVLFYFYHGIANLKLNRFEEAKKDFNYGLTINKNIPEIYNNLAILHYTIGENEEAIDNFLKTLKINNKLIDAFIGVTNSLSHTKNYEGNNSEIISIHKELNKISFDYSPNKIIKKENIKIYLKKINEIMNSKFNDVNFNITQTYRRNKPPLACDRHKKIFNEFDAIPKFCFSCYKVQIDIDNVVDLIKLYLLFDKIEIPNIRKCMIETRSKISGKYKGLILCSSIEESKTIQTHVEEILYKNVEKFNCKIKRGCTEYGFKYANYDDLSIKSMKYNPEWKKFEDLVDKKNPSLSFEKKNKSTIKGMTLYDSLILRNWLAYARLIGDKTYEEITDQTFISQSIERTLKKNNRI